MMILLNISSYLLQTLLFSDELQITTPSDKYRQRLFHLEPLSYIK